MSLMFPQLTSFFSDLKYGLKSSVSGNTGSRRGSYKTAAATATTSSMDDLDESRSAPGYSCLGSRSASMECGLSGLGQRRRRRRFRKPKLCSAESLDRLSDRVYSAMSLIEMSQQHRTTPARATFAMDLNTNNETNSSTDRISSDLVGTGIAPNADHFTPTRSVYAGKTSTPRSSGRIHGRRNVSATQIPAAARAKNVPTSDETPLSPVNPPDTNHDPLQRTGSWQSTASAASSASGGGSSSRTGPVPKPRSTTSIQTGADEVDLGPVRRPGRDTRRRPAPSTQPQKPGARSQSSPGDRVKSPQQAPPPPHVKSTTPSRNGVVSGGRSGTPRSHQQVDRSLGSVDSPLSAFVDRSGLVFDVRSKTAYRRGRLLGKGGFAKCYELTDVKTSKTYAGKVIAKSRIVKASQKDKIIREVELHRGLRHQNVVYFHSFFEDDTSVYMVLEFCSRKSLVHVLKNRSTLTEPEVRYYMRHLVAGLRYIHSRRVIHRDLKLGNMLLDDAMLLKIADFGLATRVEYDGEKKMTVCGTPNYIAPEVLQKRGHTYTADIWGLGCVMYALLCGRPPFETSTLKETYMRIVNNKFTIPPHVSMSARDLICCLLTLAPTSRPSLDQINNADFFIDGHLPTSLDPSTCHTPPKFPLPAFNPSRSRVSVVSVSTSPTTTIPPSSSLAMQSKTSRKSASQIITRAKTPDNEVAAGSLDREGYPHQAGSAPSMPPDVSSELPGLPAGSAARLYRLLVACLEADTVANSAVTQVHRPWVLYVSKWVDYSNKYGFGFQLSDNCVGIMFNDNTRMTLTSDKSTVQYNDLSNRTYSFSAQSAPPEHQKKVTLLLYFAEYMYTHLSAGGNIGLQQLHAGIDAGVRDTPVFMKKWFRTDRAIVMYLTNGTLQVNFLDDHTKLIINCESSSHDHLVTYVNSSRHATSYQLTALRHFGMTSDVKDRLHYASMMLQRVISLDGESV